jgi:hypothetical protein
MHLPRLTYVIKTGLKVHTVGARSIDRMFGYVAAWSGGCQLLPPWLCSRVTLELNLRQAAVIQYCSTV